MLQLINLSIYTLTCIIFYFTNNIVTKPNKNVILNTTLPYGKLDNPDVLNIINNYKKSNLYGCIFCFLITIPTLLINSVSFNIIYMLLWILFIIIINGLIMKKYVGELRKLKSDNNWFYSKKHIIRIDTKLSALRNKMIFSKAWFIPSLILNIILFFFQKDLLNNCLAICNILITILCFLFYHIYSNKPSIVYSENSDVNISCNLVYKRIWSLTWILLSSLFSIYNLLINLNSMYILTCTALLCIITPIIIVLAYLYIRNTQNKILIYDESIFYTDDDEYWGTFFYNNPNDHNLFVDDRTGIGMTINMGHSKAKIISIIFSLFTLAIIIPTIVICISSDYADITLANANDSITIKSSIYDLNFNKNDIEDISIIDSMPSSGIRTNGIATNKFLIGHFNYNSYGNCMVFVNCEVSEEIIVIKLNNQYVFLTGDTYNETNEFYNLLK